MKYCVLIALLGSGCMADFERSATSEAGDDTDGGGDGDGDGDCPGGTVPGWPGCWRVGDARASCDETCEPWAFDPVRTRHTGAPVALHLFPGLGVGEPLLPVECLREDIGIVWASTGESPTGDERSNCQPVCVCVP